MSGTGDRQMVTDRRLVRGDGDNLKYGGRGEWHVLQQTERKEWACAGLQSRQNGLVKMTRNTEGGAWTAFRNL